MFRSLGLMWEAIIVSLNSLIDRVHPHMALQLNKTHAKR